MGRIDKKQLVKEKLRQRKKQSKKNKHRARLIIKNLPFATTEDNLRKHFEEFGEIDEIKLLKKEDGKLVGCGFVQFKLVQKAAKARHHTNGKPFLDRNIECDWAVPKSKFVATQNEVKIKTEPMNDGYETVVKTEPADENSIEANVVNDSMKEEVEDEDETKSEISMKSEKEEDDDDDIEEVEETKHNIEEEENDIKPKKPFVQSNDATEGKTVFITNVPFTANNDDVRQCFSQFGPLYYALVCMDSLTEHSKGTAFVKFRNKEDSDKCLQEQNITLMGNILECKCAITRDELQRSKERGNKTQQRDSRNLYLIKEGVILAGGKAAEGVSASDMAKRLQVEQYKNQMLRDLNMFVARTRLIVHNVPANWDDSKLRTLFKKYSGPGAVIKEARIMRNMKFLDNKGIGKSKEFGFVTFTTHEAALDALRVINNNPHIFTASRRPIVAFSIENRAKLQMKERRMHNSQIKNPKNKLYNPNAPKYKPKNKKKEAKQSVEANSDMELQHFSGVTAKPGVNKMRSKFNLKTQARIHHEQLKKEKKSKKSAKKTLKQKQAEFTKQPRQKINKNKNKESDDFSKLVGTYKKQLFNVPLNSTQKKKWFE